MLIRRQRSRAPRGVRRSCPPESRFTAVGTGVTASASMHAEYPGSEVRPQRSGTRRLSSRNRQRGSHPNWYAHEFALRGLGVTLQDLPPVVEALREKEHCRGIHLHAADALEEVAAGPFDLVLCCTLTNMLDVTATRALLANAARSLAPGGTLAVVTYMRDRNTTGAWCPDVHQHARR